MQPWRLKIGRCGLGEERGRKGPICHADSGRCGWNWKARKGANVDSESEGRACLEDRGLGRAGTAKVDNGKERAHAARKRNMVEMGE